MASLNPIKVVWMFVFYVAIGAAMGGIAAVGAGYCGMLIAAAINERFGGPAFAVGVGLGLLWGLGMGMRFFIGWLEDARGEARQHQEWLAEAATRRAS